MHSISLHVISESHLITNGFVLTLFCLLILRYSRVALSTYIETRKWSILSKLKLSKLGYTHSDVISAASPGFMHLFWYVAMVIWTGIEFISVENVMQNLSLLETLLYCAADGSDTKTDDDTEWTKWWCWEWWRSIFWHKRCT